MYSLLREIKPLSRGHTDFVASPERVKRDRRDWPWAELALVLGTLAAMALLVVAVDPLRHAASAALHGDSAAVRDQIDGLGAWGPLIIIALALLHAFVFYPAEIVDAAAGFAYGFFPGLLLVQAGWLASGLLCWGIGRRAARPLLQRLLGGERFDRAEKMVARGGATLLLTARLVPILPFSLVSYAAGAARVPLWRFVWTTALGYLPITAIAVYLGTRLESFSLSDPLVLAGIGTLLLLVLAARFLVPRSREGEPARSERV
jgi:uncharacterized membrane protein YdjX (TVP38/TMEM64 family)